MKIFAKLTGSFIVVALICAIVGGVGWQGINSTEKGLSEVSDIALPSIQGLALMMGAMGEIKAAERTLINAAFDNKTRQRQYAFLTDSWTQFKMGRDIYEPLPQTPEEAELWKKLPGLISQWQAANVLLVDKVKPLELDDVETLLAEIIQRHLDHVKWVNSLEIAVNQGKQFPGQLDPTLCGFGKWQSTFKSDDASFNAIINAMTAPHQKLHSYGKEINDMLAAGKTDQARLFFEQEVKPALHAIEEQFASAVKKVRANIASLDASNEIAINKIRPVFNELKEVLTQITDINVKRASEASHNAKTTAGHSKTTATVTVILGAMIAVAFGVFLSRSISTPLAQGVAMLKSMSEGNISNRLKMERSDEIGVMAKAMDAMADNLTSMIRNIGDGVKTLSSSATEMSAISNQMTSGAEGTVSKANAVAAAAEEMTSNMHSVAASMEQASINVNTVAAAAEEMSANINNVSNNVNDAKSTANSAVILTQRAAEQVNSLGLAAEAIAVVTETIKAISDKTNLLALNATIEAARAGAAGKGFTVVANEIKELAQQTANATGDISQKLNGIQKATSTTVTEINEVVSAINQVDGLISSIAAAIGQQNIATRDISENINQTSQGLSEINTNVTQTSQAAGQVAKEIADVNESANEISSSSTQVQQSANDLSKLSEQLQGMVNQFKI